MSTNQFQTTKIALITDDLTNVELIEEAREKLPQQEDKYPGVAAFASMKVTPYSSTDKAHTKLFSDPQACAELQLIVLDGTVRKESTVGTSGNSAAAMSLLDWLTANIPDVPVIVLASTRVEGLDLRQSRRARKNILALDIANLDINMDLGRALHGALNSESLDELHVTLRIGEYTARHSTMSGGIELKGDDYIYRNLQDIHQLVDTVNDFSPMINGEPTFDWQTKLRELGNNVYDSLIAGTIGKHIAKHYKLENQQAPVDLRVEIDVAPNETAQLYGLPFELARPPEYHDKYLCTCIPMARRIHFVKGLKRLAHEEDPEGCDVIEEVASDEDEEDHRSLSPNDELATLDRPLRLLFINASFEGSALVRRDSPPYKIETIHGLSHLLNTPDELKTIKNFATKTPKGADRPPLESVTVVSPTGAYKTAAKFRQRIEQLVESQYFDILHFSGHSVTLKDDGGTFLILPDEGGMGVAVSARVLAKWVTAAHIRVVLLASCSGSSLRTAIEVMRTDAEAVLGFRWDVNDHACVEYFKRFYELYLNKRMRISQAYCGACSEVRTSEYGLPVWASAIAVVKN